jgi:hypothetical protein
LNRTVDFWPSDSMVVAVLDSICGRLFEPCQSVWLILSVRLDSFCSRSQYKTREQVHIYTFMKWVSSQPVQKRTLLSPSPDGSPMLSIPKTKKNIRPDACPLNAQLLILVKHFPTHVARQQNLHSLRLAPRLEEQICSMHCHGYHCRALSSQACIALHFS